MDFLDKATASRKGAKADSLFEEGNFKKALELYFQYLKYKIEKGDSEGRELAPYYKKIGDCYMKLAPGVEQSREHNIEKAVKYYSRAGEKYEESGDKHNAGMLYKSVANCFELGEEHDKASEYDRKSAELFSETGEGFQASHSFVEAGGYAYASGDYKTAADSYVKAAEFEESLKDDTKASEYYEKAGKCMEHLSDFDMAMEHYSLALGLYDKIKSYEKAAAAFESIGRCKEKVNDFQNAINNYLKASKINTSEKNHSGTIANYMSVGDCNEKLGKTDEAVKYYLKAVEVAVENKDGLSKAAALMKAANSQKTLGELDNAVMNYISAGEAYDSAGKRKEAVGVFNGALEISLSEAKKNEGNGDFDAAALNYQKASFCYFQLKDFERAADLYYQNAQSKLRAGEKIEAFDAYTQAGHAYAKSDLLNKAGDAYMRANKFDEAASHFIQHAEKATKKKDFFESAKYFDLAAWCFKKLFDDKQERDAMNSSIWQYVAFLDVKKDEPDPLKEAEANLRIGEGYLKLEDTRKAIKNMLKARELFEKTGDSEMVLRADAQVKLIDGKIALKAADYIKAHENLNKAIELLGKIDLEKLEEFDRYHVETIREGAEQYLSEIDSRPDVEIELEVPASVMVDVETKLSGKIINNGNQVVERIVILTSFPSSILVRKATKECLKVEPGETFDLEVVIQPNEVGSFVFNPLEILYHDIEDHKYMKSSLEITLNVSSEKTAAVMEAEAEQAESDEDVRVSDKIMRAFIGTDPSSIVLVSYNPPSHAQVVESILEILVKERGEGGVYVSVSKPYKHTQKLMEDKGIQIENLRFIDCITRASGNIADKSDNVVYVESPASLEEISMYSEKLIKDITTDKKFLIIDSVSSLLIYNDERAIEELIHFLVNQIRSDEVGGVILSADEASTQKIIRRLIPTCDKEIKV
ncbi:MAG: tetratricopeptide repeat protein [Methanobacteriota archaeon]